MGIAGCAFGCPSSQYTFIDDNVDGGKAEEVGPMSVEAGSEAQCVKFNMMSRPSTHYDIGAFGSLSCHQPRI